MKRGREHTRCAEKPLATRRRNLTNEGYLDRNIGVYNFQRQRQRQASFDKVEFQTPNIIHTAWNDTTGI